MAYTTIDNPGIYFNTVIYTGNGTAIGSGGQAITGVGFQPDWVWIKDRTDADRPRMFDSVRGVTKELDSSDTTAETTLTEGLTAFGSDGFTVGNHAGVNSGSDNFVAWNWLGANGTASNSDGTLTSTVSANTTAGFSIVSYTGSGSTTSFGHGLGVAPKWVIIKNREDTDGWTVFHTGISSGQGYIFLNTTAAATTGSSRRFRYGDGSDGKIPDTTKVYLGNSSDVNTSGEDYIAYCFAEKKGYSKFGSYAPNGSADGNFIYLGFSPAFFLVKNTNTTRNWLIFDNKRNTSNEITKSLEANTSDAEQTDSNLKVDFLSNGVKLRGLGGDLNTSDGVNYIYMAFAEAPFVNSKGVPTNAR